MLDAPVYDPGSPESLAEVLKWALGAPDSEALKEVKALTTIIKKLNNSKFLREDGDEVDTAVPFDLSGDK